jgi:hypothetical protein
MTHVPCERILHLTPEEKVALALADNRLAEHSSWHEPNLTLKLEELSTSDLEFDLEITGFDTVDLDRLLGPEPDPRQAKADGEGYSQDPDDRIPALHDERPAISQSGDLWTLGHHGLLHGDALDPLSYALLLGHEAAAQVIFDSPYNVPNRGHVSAKPFREFAKGAWRNVVGRIRPLPRMRTITRGPGDARRRDFPVGRIRFCAGAPGQARRRRATAGAAGIAWR